MVCGFSENLTDFLSIDDCVGGSARGAFSGGVFLFVFANVTEWFDTSFNCVGGVIRGSFLGAHPLCAFSE